MPDTPLILAELAARLRALPRDNPQWPADALLIGADALDVACLLYTSDAADEAYDV